MTIIMRIRLYLFFRNIISRLSFLIPHLVKNGVLHSKYSSVQFVEHDKGKLCVCDFGDYALHICREKSRLTTYLLGKAFGQGRQLLYDELVVQQIQLKTTGSQDGTLHIITDSDMKIPIKDMTNRLCDEVVSKLIKLGSNLKETEDKRKEIVELFSKIDKEVLIPFIQTLRSPQTNN